MPSLPVTLSCLRPVTFDPSSTGQLALVLYEWSDVKYLGADTPGDDSLPVRQTFGMLLPTVPNLARSLSRKPTFARRLP